MRSLRGAAIALLAAGWMLGSGGAPAVAATLKVTTTQDETNASDGQCSLREAIEQGNSPGSPGDPSCGKATNSPNTIVLGAHQYHLTIPPIAFDSDFDHGDLKFSSLKTLTVRGAGPGKTIIDATGLGERAFQVVNGAFAALQNLTVKGGHAPDGANGATGSTGGTSTNGGDGVAGGSGENGGGIENFGTLTLKNVVITANHAGNGGAGGTGGQGGPAFSSHGGNGGPGGNGGVGGGIYNHGRLTVINSTISGNHAGNGGSGGVGGSPDSGAGYYAGNGAPGGCCGDGGGIASVGSSATVTVLGSTIIGNFAGNGGDGGAGGSAGADQAGNGNNGSDGSWGGGISNVGGRISVTNSTVADNRSGNGGQAGPGGFPGNGGSGGTYGAGGNGGGLRITSPAAARLRNVTIAHNATGINTDPYLLTPGHGGGIWEQSPAKLENTLLASNGNGGNCATNTGTVLTQFVNGGHNLSFGDLSCPSSFASGNPELGKLRSNGGPTQTIAIGAASAARNTVPATGAHCPALDQRGVRRPSGSACDIGAYELAPPKISSGPVIKLTRTGVTVTDSLLPNQVQAAAYFEFGRTRRYGSHTSIQHAFGLSITRLSVTLTGLRPGTTYHYRMLATSVDGNSAGPDQTFTTKG